MKVGKAKLLDKLNNSQKSFSTKKKNTRRNLTVDLIRCNLFPMLLITR